VRRKYIKSYKPDQSTSIDLDMYTDDIWAFYGGPGRNPGWVEDINGMDTLRC
jgi:hypothetical protein